MLQATNMFSSMTSNAQASMNSVTKHMPFPSKVASLLSASNDDQTSEDFKNWTYPGDQIPELADYSEGADRSVEETVEPVVEPVLEPVQVEPLYPAVIAVNGEIHQASEYPE